MPGKFKFITICMRPNRDSSTRRSRSVSPHFFRPPNSPIKTNSTPCTKCAGNGAAAATAFSYADEKPSAPISAGVHAKVRQPLRSIDKMAAPTRVLLLACGSYNPITNMHLRMFEIARDYLHHTGKYQVIGGVLSPVNDGYKKQSLISSKHRIEMCKMAVENSDWLKVDTWEAEQPNWLTTVKVLTHFDSELNSNKVNNNPEPELPLLHTPRCMTVPTRRGTKRRRNLRKNEPPASNDNKLFLELKIRKRKREADTEVDDAYGAPNLNTNANQLGVEVKLLCGADLLESFAVPDLWDKEDLETIVGKHGLVVITRSGSDPYKFIYESDLLFKYSDNIHIVTEWISNEISSTKIRTALRRDKSVKYLIPEPVVKYVKENGLYKEAPIQAEKNK
ncbi:nicotinamide/nicotinic acid mononucleotide adenylyltransferase 1 isoform X2 [Strongylocentrotus purpuratus]|uniref:Cytidyltransferase-like domain-containing protein n=1 Tax=Strongylocentrotus purpuratus TaxID=7668 RepID=A0A7M7HE94_STRPU|nr:nicotinamide/nicotinic acid mononucleotide adenylyltransferase 1 isoform X2 [Strongylocentrotus purpuratus]|eukprot:XP_011661095.1 PREDICTED: nicotinamide/nicotinic acid mononucleotide adenylyltransferase 1 isoform X2 [Strongylocentrotus purpuratus]